MAKFIKVTNYRQGDVGVHTPRLVFPPGVSYHALSVFEDLNKNHPNVLEGLKLHDDAGEMRFEPVEVNGDAPPQAPAYKSGLLPFLPEDQIPDKPKPQLPANGAPPLSLDRAEALAQIATETNAAVLDAWFNGQPAPTAEISDAIMNRVAMI